jgi:isopentenyldiphosphate isomerase
MSFPPEGVPEEVFDVVDEDGLVIGSAPRSVCHSDPALIHQSVHVFVIDPQGRIYLQKRAGGKDIQPGRWDTSVGGHLERGESHEAAAGREMREELGLSGDPRFLYRYLWRSDRETELVETYLLETPDEPVPDPGEIDEGRYFTLQEIDGMMEGDSLTPNLKEELRRLRECGVLPP